MKKTNCLFTLWVATLCAGNAYAVGTAPAVFSQYGEIQSVKNYSSNPFWNKNSPYNQNFPKPIYATGADLNTGDCNRVVENLVSAYCAGHSYCRNTRINDIRPTVMVQLSQLPGHNFATSCGGYIDAAFEKFQKEYGNTSTVNLPNTATQITNIKIANPFAQKTTATQQAVADRTAELERLQSITTPTATIGAAAFPKTTSDLSFTDRLANTTAGYEPYKDMASYKKPEFLGEDEEYFNRLRAQNFDKFCERRPTDPECVKQREHQIIYVPMGGNVTNCKTKTYETGKGATVTCVPTRKHSRFMGWCTAYDAATDVFSGCASPQTIAPTETTDITFYAKWECEKHEPAYIKTQTECIDPEEDTPKIIPPTTCPDPYMDPLTCKCEDPYEETAPGSNVCKCKNGKDPATGCTEETPPNGNGSYEDDDGHTVYIGPTI